MRAITLGGIKQWAVGLAAMATVGLTAGCQPVGDPTCAEELTKWKSVVLQQEANMERMKSQIATAERRAHDAEVERDMERQKYAAARNELVSVVNQQPPPAFVGSGLPQKMRDQLDDLARRFGARFENNRLQLPNSLFFGSGQYKPNARAKEILTQLAHILRNENLTLMIVGHTDSVPVKNPALRNRGITDNRMLSMVRAKEVMDVLQTSGYPSNLMYATGWADLKPMVPGTARNANDMNRRVEILIDTAAADLFGISETQGIVMPEVAVY